jgi:glucan endo-1,3-alpha-glucosidase
MRIEKNLSSALALAQSSVTVSRPQKRVVLLLPVTLLALLGSEAIAQTSNPIIAHWEVSMTYTPNEDAPHRAQDDIRAAMDEGLDGFIFDAFTGKQAKGDFEDYLAVADQIGAANFKIALSVDMSKDFPAADIVEVIKEYGNNPHYLKIHGRPLLSTFGGQEKGDQWWKDNVIDPLARSGHPVTFIPDFDRDSPNADPPTRETWNHVVSEYPTADGLFNFILPGSLPFPSNDSRMGNHKWSLTEGSENLSATLQTRHKLYMATYMPYYWAVCHSARQYLEFRGGEGMDAEWQSIILHRHTDAVEIVTWNDYTESTFIQPTAIPKTGTPGIVSMPHTGYYELLKYYISWYRTSQRPTISKDAIFYFYRTQPIRPEPAQDTACKMGPIDPRQLWGDVQDRIFITTALMAPAQLRVTSGGRTSTISVAAGLNSAELPFLIGPQHFELWRNGKLVAKADGVPVTPTDSVQNLNVYSGYVISDGSNSSSFAPSDHWKPNGIPVADWFQ